MARKPASFTLEVKAVTFIIVRNADEELREEMKIRSSGVIFYLAPKSYTKLQSYINNTKKTHKNNPIVIEKKMAGLMDGLITRLQGTLKG